MKVHYVDGNGNTEARNIDNITQKELKDHFHTDTPESELKSKLDNLNMPGEIKARLWQLREWSMKVGRRLYRFGRKILEVAIEFVVAYPNATLALILGFLFWSLILGYLPVIGDKFGAILTLILGAIGFTKDMFTQSGDKTRDLQNKLQEVFGPRVVTT